MKNKLTLSGFGSLVLTKMGSSGAGKKVTFIIKSDS